MKIAPYYQKLLQKCLVAISSFEPITFIGMFDSGVDYLFTTLRPLVASEISSEKGKVFFIDLSGLVQKELIVSEIWFAISAEEIESTKQNYASLTKRLLDLAQKEKFIFVVYLGQEGEIDQGFFLLLNRLRNLLGWNFSYALFGTSRLLQNKNLSQTLIQKVFKRNLVPVLPLGKEDALVVLGNYEERYKTEVASTTRVRIIELSGGNPGLIKALYLQAISLLKWHDPDYLEEQLHFRLSGIVEDLSREMQKYLFSKQSGNAEVERFLLDYGYARHSNGKLIPFTPMLAEFAKNYVQQRPHEVKTMNDPADPLILNFTRSQRKVLEYLTQRKGELVSKDALAQVLWGDAWADKYSDWAIDQLMSTLRERIKESRMKERIVTKKGEGVILTS